VSIGKANLTVALVIAYWMAISTPCKAEATKEAQVKAAFVYNFTQFVDWPAGAFAGPDAPFVVAIVGDDPFSGAIEEAMDGQSVNGRPIAVRHFASAKQIERCQLLIVPASQQAAAPVILAKIANAPVLTVGDGDSFMAQGGAIRLFQQGARVRFELSPDVMAAARVVPGAKLMKLARIYRK